LHFRLIYEYNPNAPFKSIGSGVFKILKGSGGSILATIQVNAALWIDSKKYPAAF
jgi:hypothetical protein